MRQCDVHGGYVCREIDLQICYVAADSWRPRAETVLLYLLLLHCLLHVESVVRGRSLCLYVP